jgi:hypothetical protein
MPQSEKDHYNPTDMDGEAFGSLLSPWRQSSSGLQRQSTDGDGYSFPEVTLERRTSNKYGSLWFIPWE